jgi:hypothetical protein
VRGFIVLAMLVGVAGTAGAQYATSPPKATAGATTPSACQGRLEKIAEFQPLPVIAGPGECGAVDAVLLQSVILSAQTRVAVVPPATLRCTMAEAVATWLRQDVAPTALKLGSAIRQLENFDSYDCRGRNRIAGATLSEHGRANALDVRGFKLADGRVIELTDVNVVKNWREALRASACARFDTVLGPGSDGYHEAHIHLDLAARRGGYKICQWDVHEPIIQAGAMAPTPEQSTARIEEPVPLPRPRPPVGVAADKAKMQSKKIGAQLR